MVNPSDTPQASPSSPPEQIIPPRFIQLVKEIDRGATGCVWLCRDTRVQVAGKEAVAVKFIRRGSVDERVKRELLIVRKLYHRHIALFREAVLGPTHLCLLFDFVPGGNLESYLKSMGGILPEYIARFIFQQLVLAVDFCHQVPPDGIMNRDLKLNNVLVENPKEQFPHIVLCDFGFGKESGAEPTISHLGTKNYAAPEIIWRSSRNNRYDGKKTDIYCLGICLHRMVLGAFPKHPEAGEGQPSSAEERLRRMGLELHGDLRVLHGSPQLAALLTGLLQPNPAYRFTMEDVWRDPWFQTELPVNDDGSPVRSYNTAMLAFHAQGTHLQDGQTEEDLRRMVEEARAA
ncbi:unnamed protein product [Ostreobium quekettii]|uniref:Protein kinase domain-containing protein n=1 Tax=Ostreobium quekettii TaxID=121088 RepID=A0A8S1J2Q5_9CHLO|nr:unnamed protein product [Ostreobium quekettii]|eukprot:evm.model.scf_1710.3 EVM.evm.TU.scf_1710.3   scf_1710:18020-21303(-)